jgi:four helix bundle protein
VVRYAEEPFDATGSSRWYHVVRVQDFHRLRVWERAHRFVLDVRKLVQSFPRSGYSELKSQLMSAAESIPSNIVEGSAAASRKEFARYLDISIKSTSEVEYHLQLAVDYAIMRPNRWRELSNEVVQIRRMVVALRRKLLDTDRRPPHEEPDD